MNRLRLWLAILLCVVLLGIAPFAGSAEAPTEADPASLEVAQETPAPSVPEGADVSTGSAVPEPEPALQTDAPEADVRAEDPMLQTAAPDPEPTGEQEAPEEVTPAPDPDVESTVEPTQTAAPDADALTGVETLPVAGAKNAAEDPSFVRGYAVVLQTARAYASASDTEAQADLHAGGVVYAADRRREGQMDRLEARFLPEGGVMTTLWLDAEVLRPLDEEETAAFVADAAENPLAVCCDAASTLPLLPVSCVFIALTQEETPPEPVAEETPEPITMALPQSRITLGVGEKYWISPAFSDGEAHGVRFASKQKKTASVTAAGMVKGIRTGKTTISVIDEYGNRASLAVTVKKAPTSVKLNAKKVYLGIGCTGKLTAALSKGSAGAWTFTSSDPTVVAVQPDGTLTPLAPGQARVTVRTYNRKSASAQVIVRPAPTEVRLLRTELDLGVGERLALQAAVDPGSLASFSFASDRPDIAAVQAGTGWVTAVEPGTAVLSVTTQNGLTDTCTVRVHPAPTGLQLGAYALTLGKGQTSGPIPVSLVGEDACGAVSFTTSNKRIARVNAAGQVRGMAVGTAKITVRTYNGKKAVVKVTVKKAPSSIALAPRSAVLGVGETLALRWKFSGGSAGGVTLGGYDPEIISISEGNLVTALKPGQTTITARTHNGKKAWCNVIVREAPQSLSLSESEKVLGAGEHGWLCAQLPENTAGAIHFQSSAPEIVCVDANTGAVQALRAGSAVITAAAYNGVHASCAITALNAPTGVRLWESSVTLAVGDYYQLGAPVLEGADAACSTFAYASGSQKYAKVSAAGLIKGIRAGTTSVTVRTYNGKSATIKVYVKAAPKALKFSVNALRLLYGETYVPQVIADNGAPCSHTLALSGEGVVEFGEDGRTLRAVGSGSVTLTARAFNGKTAALEITVPELPDSVSLDPDSLRLGAGDAADLRVAFPVGQGSVYTLASADPEIAVLEGTGVLRANRPGRTTVTVMTANGKSAECAVEVLAAPTEIRLSPRRNTFALSEGSVQLAVAYASEAEGGRWSAVSAKPAVATVSPDGRVTFHKAGSTTIRVQTYNGLQAEWRLIVTGSGEGLRFIGPEIAIPLGAEMPLPLAYATGGGSYEAFSADESIASVEGSWIRGLALGSTELTAVGYNGETATCQVTVVVAEQAYRLSADRAELHTGESLELTVSPRPEGADIIFASSAEDIASVDAESGLVVAKSTGECLISAQNQADGMIAYCRILVTGLLDGVKIGIDPGHQARANTAREAIAPGSTKTKYKVTGGCGGYATGMQEYKLVLNIGFQLRAALEALGAEVYMTRTSNNVDISNQERAAMMNEYGVDLVLRLHCNSVSNHDANGISTWVRSTGTGREDCARAGQALLQQMLAATGARNDGLHRTDNYTGLNWSVVPSVLVEMGYMSNAAEDVRLNDPDYQAKLIRGMVNGICVYMNVPCPGQ